jgi:hypothetical protein
MVHLVVKGVGSYHLYVCPRKTQILKFVAQRHMATLLMGDLQLFTRNMTPMETSSSTALPNMKTQLCVTQAVKSTVVKFGGSIGGQEI